MMEFPNFGQHLKSPKMSDLGVAVNFEAKTFKVGTPVIIYGSYYVDGEFIKQCNDEPHTWILLTVIRRDKPEIWTKLVREKPNLAPIPKQDLQQPGPTVRRGGFFNIDLRTHFGLPDEPGRYWLVVSLGDYITEIIPFEFIK